MRTLLIVSVVFVFGLACGDDDRAGSDSGTDGAVTSSDPRCAALCAIDTSDLDVCSSASAAQCVALCENRVAEVGALCGECLLEDATFGGGARSPAFCETSPECTMARCDLRGCTYCSEDEAMLEACRTMVRREVSCDTDFRSVTECTDLCS